MKRFVRCGGLFLLLVAFVVPTFAGDPVKKEGGETTKKQEKDKKKAEGKFEYGTKYVGKVTQVDNAGTNRDFTLHVSGKVQELNQNEYNAMQQAMQRAQQHLASANNTKNPNTRATELRHYQENLTRVQQHQAKLYQTKEVKADYKFRPAENVIYRTLYPEPQYNDKGEVVTPTKKELEVLKGKHKDLPGYEAMADVLRVNAQAAVYTARPRPAGLKKTDDDPVLSDRPEVVLIVIINAPPAPAK